jgi:hypothetical protein
MITEKRFYELLDVFKENWKNNHDTSTIDGWYISTRCGCCPDEYGITIKFNRNSYINLGDNIEWLYLHLLFSMKDTWIETDDNNNIVIKMVSN